MASGTPTHMRYSTAGIAVLAICVALVVAG